MKLVDRVAVCAFCGLFVIATGCGKKEESAPAVKSAEEAMPDLEKQSEAQKAAAEEAAKAAEARAAEEAAKAVAGAQSLIDKAKALVEGNKYTESLSILQQLATVKLAPEQQKLVDDLKAFIQKKMAEEAAAKRLPTEDEWTKAADGAPAPLGAGPPLAGTKPPGLVYADPGDKSARGAVGMAGNVSEWTAPVPNRDIAVVRGGSWRDPAAQRAELSRRARTDTVGFRCAADKPPKP